MRREQIELTLGMAVLTTTQIGERLGGMHPSVTALIALGVQPVKRTRTGCYWALRDMPRIRRALSAQVLRIQPDEE